MTFSTGQCLRPVLNGPPRVTSKEKHQSSSHMCDIGGIVRQTHARLDVAGSNPRYVRAELPLFFTGSKLLVPVRQYQLGNWY